MTGGRQVVIGNYNSANEVSIIISSQDNSLVARISSYSYSCTFTKQPGPYVLTFDYDSKVMRTFVDGTPANTTNTNQTVNWGSTAIGRSGTGNARAWAGDIAEIIIFDRVLEDGEREAVEQYLTDKWFSEPDPEPISAVHFTPTPNLREGTENVAYGAIVGTLSATDGIGGITYSLVAGEGDADNGRFVIDGNKVKVAGEALTAGTYNFRVKAADDKNEVEGNFSITVAEKSELPTEGLVLWLDAHDYDAGTGVWPDQSDKNNTVEQTSASDRPKKANAEELGGKPVVQFDGSSYLDLTWADGSLKPDPNHMTMFLVIKNESEGKTQVVLGNYGSENEFAIIRSSQSPFNVVARIFGGGYSWDSCTFTNDSGPYVLTFDWNSSLMRTFVNGVEADTQSSTRTIDWKNTTIGRSGTGSTNYWQGYIAEIMIFDRVLSDNERQSVEEYLYDKWFGSL